MARLTAIRRSKAAKAAKERSTSSSTKTAKKEGKKTSLSKPTNPTVERQARTKTATKPTTEPRRSSRPATPAPTAAASASGKKQKDARGNKKRGEKKGRRGKSGQKSDSSEGDATDDDNQPASKKRKSGSALHDKTPRKANGTQESKMKSKMKTDKPVAGPSRKRATLDHIEVEAKTAAGRAAIKDQSDTDSIDELADSDEEDHNEADDLHDFDDFVQVAANVSIAMSVPNCFPLAMSAVPMVNSNEEYGWACLSNKAKLRLTDGSFVTCRVEVSIIVDKHEPSPSSPASISPSDESLTHHESKFSAELMDAELPDQMFNDDGFESFDLAGHTSLAGPSGDIDEEDEEAHANQIGESSESADEEEGKMEEGSATGMDGEQDDMEDEAREARRMACGDDADAQSEGPLLPDGNSGPENLLPINPALAAESIHLLEAETPAANHNPFDLTNAHPDAAGLTRLDDSHAGSALQSKPLGTTAAQARATSPPSATSQQGLLSADEVAGAPDDNDLGDDNDLAPETSNTLVDVPPCPSEAQDLAMADAMQDIEQNGTDDAEDGIDHDDELVSPADSASQVAEARRQL